MKTNPMSTKEFIDKLKEQVEKACNCPDCKKKREEIEDDEPPIDFTKRRKPL
jgi:hypothetical protein